jgi:hypothetical protein
MALVLLYCLCVCLKDAVAMWLLFGSDCCCTMLRMAMHGEMQVWMTGVLSLCRYMCLLCKAPKMSPRMVRNLCVLFLVSLTCVPPQDGARGGRQLQQPMAIYWRRGRRLALLGDTRMAGIWELWERLGFCSLWRTWAKALHMYRYEMRAACYLCGCILAVPFLGIGAGTVKYISYMTPTKLERWRCCGETLLLCSLWQGCDTKCIAVLGWLCWFCDLHCGTGVHCRGLTWLLVCLAQRDVRTVKLVLLSVLAFLTPLYGKRPGEVVDGDAKRRPGGTKTSETSTSLQKGLIVVEDETSKADTAELGFVDAYAPSLQHVRSGWLVCADAFGEPGDLLTDFPFVPEEFLAVLLSIYSQNLLIFSEAARSSRSKERKSM